MKINEDNFIKELRRKNEKALIYVVDEYGGLLNSIIGKHLYSIKDQMEECLNDVFMGIWNNIEYFDESKNNFKNWAAGIARFKSIDYLRKREKELIEQSYEEITLSQEDSNLLHEIEQESSEEITKILSCLNDRDQELFWKVYIEEQDLDQVSKETGIKKEVIYNRLSRGRKKIRKNYQGGMIQ